MFKNIASKIKMSFSKKRWNYKKFLLLWSILILVALILKAIVLFLS